MKEKVSIPERAREIAAKWINENNVLYIPLGSLMKLATEAMHSERELVIGELNGAGMTEAANLLKAAK